MSADAGLLAVARVRGVREQDSRLGLRRAHDEHTAARARHDDAEARLGHAVAQAATFNGSGAAFAGVRAQLATLEQVVSRAAEEAGRSTSLLDVAHAHWQHQRTRLHAVELLLERRATARRELAARRETAALDEAAAQRWLRGGGRR